MELYIFSKLYNFIILLEVICSELHNYKYIDIILYVIYQVNLIILT